MDQILIWLAARRGEALDAPTTWRLSLLTNFGDDRVDLDPAEVRRLAAMYARAAGSVVGDVRFTTAGFQSYLDSLLLSA